MHPHTHGFHNVAIAMVDLNKSGVACLASTEPEEGYDIDEERHCRKSNTTQSSKAPSSK